MTKISDVIMNVAWSLNVTYPDITSLYISLDDTNRKQFILEFYCIVDLAYFQCDKTFMTP